MKSSTQIRFDFQNAKQQANRLDELANSLEQQVIRPMSDTAPTVAQRLDGGKRQPLYRQTKRTAGKDPAYKQQPAESGRGDPNHRQTGV